MALYFIKITMTEKKQMKNTSHDLTKLEYQEINTAKVGKQINNHSSDKIGSFSDFIRFEDGTFADCFGNLALIHQNPFIYQYRIQKNSKMKQMVHFNTIISVSNFFF